VTDLWVCHLGQVEYAEAAALQERLRERVIAGELPDLMLLLEHPPVYTVGRRSDADELPLGEDHYRGLGIDVVRTPRGGKLTYHGPGQLVGYPIMHVASVPDFILAMERAIVAALAEAGVEAATRLGHKHVGVWVGERKIASVGVHLSHGVSSHGFAVNVDNDLEPFGWVVACGLPDVQMTSLAAEGGTDGVACFRKRMGYAFCREFGFRQRLVSGNRIGSFALRSPAVAGAYASPSLARRQPPCDVTT
jgi:lipoyl(octanoyl) transferase